jgi:hypothetical protein
VRRGHRLDERHTAADPESASVIDVEIHCRAQKVATFV